MKYHIHLEIKRNLYKGKNCLVGLHFCNCKWVSDAKESEMSVKGVIAEDLTLDGYKKWIKYGKGKVPYYKLPEPVFLDDYPKIDWSLDLMLDILNKSGIFKISSSKRKEVKNGKSK